MFSSPMPPFVLASTDPDLIASIEPILIRSGAHVSCAFSLQDALDKIGAPTPPALAFFDVTLPGLDQGDAIRMIRASSNGHTLPLVLLADPVKQVWRQWIAEGILDDIIPRSPLNPHFQFRLDTVLRTFHRMRELERLREAAARNAQDDQLTGTHNRATLLLQLFRETDRVQRMRTPLCLTLLDIDDFAYWNARLGPWVCDDLLCQVAGRTVRMLRSYDFFGRMGNDEFMAILPGCDSPQGTLLAGRIRDEVFTVPFHALDGPIRLTACFGIASSEGRSPVVVLREAERALLLARHRGPSSIQSVGASAKTQTERAELLPPTTITPKQVD